MKFFAVQLLLAVLVMASLNEKVAAEESNASSTQNSAGGPPQAMDFNSFVKMVQQKWQGENLHVDYICRYMHI